jgi:hypothetical protein
MKRRLVLLLLGMPWLNGCADDLPPIDLGHMTVTLARQMEVYDYDTNDLFSMPIPLKERGTSLYTNKYFEVFETGTAVELNECVESRVVSSFIPSTMGYDFEVRGSIFSSILGMRIPISYCLNDHKGFHHLARAPWEGEHVPLGRHATRENVLAAISSWKSSLSNNTNQVEMDHDP